MLRSSRHQTLARSILVISSMLAFGGMAQAFTLIELEPTVIKVSTGDPVPASGPSHTANRPRYSVSDSGCDIVFTSDAKNLTATQDDSNGATDVFLYSLCGTPGITLVSHQEGKPDLAGSGLSDQPVISDGQFVVFRSTATDIVPGSGSRTNIFLWDRNTDKFTLVSHDFAKANQGGDGDSQNAVINRANPAGRPFVAFESLAGNLLSPADDNGKSDVFRFSSEDGAIELVSAPTAARLADNGSFHPNIDATGNCIVYESLATNLVGNPGGDANNALDVFRWKFAGEPAATFLVSHLPGSPDKAGDGASSEPSVDDACKEYAFKSTVKDLALNQDDTNSPANDVFLSTDAGAGNLVTVLVSHSAGSPDKTGDGESLSPILSRDGNWVAYASFATDLVSPQIDTPGTSDVFLFDVVGGKALLVSHVAKDDTAATGESDLPEISEDGRYVAYVSGAKELDPNQNDGNGDLDVFIYNRTWNNSIVASRRYASIAITGRRRSYTPALSGSGYVVAFTSEANDLVADDPGTPGEPNVFFLITPFNIPILTARSTTDTNVIEWVTPAVNYVAMRTFFTTGACPDLFSDVILANELPTGIPGPRGNTRAQFTHTGLAANTTYCYSIFVQHDAQAGIAAGDSPWATRTAHTYLNPSGRIQWALNLADTAALAQVGIGTQNHVAVANDSGVYGFTRGPSGGSWAGSSWPFRVSSPVQGRPPIIPYGTLGAARTTFVGSQNGRAYAFDADRIALAGGALWYSTPPLGANGIQPGAAGMFALFGGLGDHIYVGARTGLTGSFFALDAATGAQQGVFTGSIGAISTSASVDYAAKRVYFASLDTGGGALWCLNLTATGFGSPCWVPLAAGPGISGGPVQRNGRLYVGDDAGRAWAFDAALGSLAWSYAGCGFGSPIRFYVLADRQGTAKDLYYSAGTSLCGVTDLGATASQKWAGGPAVPGIVGTPSTPILARIGVKAFLYVGSSNGRLYQVDTDDPFAAGAVTSILLRTGAAIGPPAFDVLDNMIYVGSTTGEIFAVQAPLP